MSNLVEKYRSSCIKLTNMMEDNVRNQYDKNGYISKYEKFNTDCNEFQNFVKKVNNNTANNFFIKVNNPSCDYIKTTVDLKKESITYTLS